MWFFIRFTIIPTSGSLTFENVGSRRGARSYILNGVLGEYYKINSLIFKCALKEADIALGAIMMTSSRISEMDLLFPWSASRFSLMIPVADPSGNFNALWQPFDFLTWIAIAVSFLFVPFVLYTISIVIKRYMPPNEENGQFTYFGKAIEYVGSILVSQGCICLISLN